MSFKKTNMIIPIFIVILLLALYIFTKSPVKSINLIGPANKIRDTFIVHNNSDNNNNNNNNNNDDKNDNNSNSIINNKIRIRNRDNSLLQQYIKNDSLPITNKREQNPKEFQKMLRDDLEQNVSDVYDTLKNISTSVPIANTFINNDKYKGYNNYVSLRTDSYAPVTSIGKQLITAYSSYPIAS
jgi:hypothetical protein